MKCYHIRNFMRKINPSCKNSNRNENNCIIIQFILVVLCVPPVLLTVKIPRLWPDTMCSDDGRFSNFGVSHTQSTQAQVLKINTKNVYLWSTYRAAEVIRNTLNSLKLREHWGRERFPGEQEIHLEDCYSKRLRPLSLRPTCRTVLSVTLSGAECAAAAHKDGPWSWSAPSVGFRLLHLTTQRCHFLEHAQAQEDHSPGLASGRRSFPSATLSPVPIPVEWQKQFICCLRLHFPNGVTKRHRRQNEVTGAPRHDRDFFLIFKGNTDTQLLPDMEDY